ncbi:acyl-CoA dehydrogenase [Rhodococcus opacus]|nr:acyl-CoA dehydrogenase [Rhodococcus opacus]
MDHDDAKLLRESLEQALTAALPASWPDALDEFGWHDLLEEEAQTAISLVADCQGRLLPHSSIINDAVSSALGAESVARTDNAAPVRLVYPALGSMDPPATLEAHVDHEATVAVSGMISAGSRSSGTLLVPARAGSSLVFVSVDNPSDVGSLDSIPAAIDPDSGWRRISGTASGTVVSADAEAQQLWATALRIAHLVLAHELTAVGREMLDLAVEHVSTRKQFGRHLGSFQAVKHGLADTRVWQEAAELAAVAGWDQGDPEAAALAKSLACRFFRSAAENCQQYLGGMGFTWEHPFHTFLRRGLILEQLLGTSAVLRTQLGKALRAGTMPAIGML